MGKEKMKTLLVLDFNNLLFRYIDIHSSMEFNHKKTGGLYGFLTQLSFQVNLYKPDVVVVCHDKKPYKRNILFPDYKKKDKIEFDQERFDFINESKLYCKELLKILKIPFWEEEGYECDDLMAILVHKNKYKLDNIILTTNDDDLCQLLNMNVSIHKNKGLYTMEDFIKENGIHPSEWSEIEAMCGTHNNIPKLYDRLGRKTAIKIYKDRSKMKDLVEKYGEQYLFNLALILLPIDFNVNLKLENRCPFTFKSIENFLIHKFGITITKSMNDCFVQLNEVAYFCPDMENII